jgi:uncharacterized protein YggE
MHMKRLALICTLLATVPATAMAQQPAAPPVPLASGVRLDIVATGEVTRVPDLVTIGAGVVTRAPQAEAALRDNAQRMEAVRAALRAAGIQPRDVQTGTISLSQDYEQQVQGRAVASGYVASNTLSVRFRDVARAGRIIDALVAAGANSVNGPSFGIENRDGAVDEARAKALTVARGRADLYARSLGTRVRRLVSISESGERGIIMGEVAAMQMRSADGAATQVEPGEQMIATTLTVTFELDQPGG